MATVKMITADELCAHHNLEQKFINALQTEGLIQVSTVNKQTCIPLKELPRLEKMIHLYQDLDINVEGIASINHLLQQLDNLQTELWLLKNRLRLYENI